MANRKRLNELPLTCISADCFTWTREDGKPVGVSEVSSLPEHLVSRVYNDACDMGFMVRSPKTGKVLLFTVKGVLRGGENGTEYQGSVYEDTSGLGYSIKIFND